MKDKFASNKAKALVFVLIGLLSLGMTLGLVNLNQSMSYMSATDLLNGSDYRSGSYLTGLVMDNARESIQQYAQNQSLLTDGELDPKSTIDIQKLSSGVHCESPSPNTIYTVENLLKLYNDPNFRYLKSHVEKVENDDIPNQYYDKKPEELLDAEAISQLQGVVTEELDLSTYSANFCYLYNTARKYESVAPESGVLLADYALTTTEDVSLKRYYQQLIAASETVGEFKSQYDAGLLNTGSASPTAVSRFWYHDLKQEQIYTNCPEWELMSCSEIRETLVHDDTVFGSAAGGNADFITWTEFYNLSDSGTANAESALSDIAEYAYGPFELIVTYNPDYVAQPGEPDHTAIAMQVAQQSSHFRFGMILSSVCGVLLLICAILSMIQVGRVENPLSAVEGDYIIGKGRVSKDDPEIMEYLASCDATTPVAVRRSSYLTARTPIEILLIVDVLTWIMFAGLMTGAFYLVFNIVKYGPILIIGLGVLGSVFLALWQILTFLSKAKSRNLTTNSLCKTVWTKLSDLLTSRTVKWQTILKFVAFGILLLIGGAAFDEGVGILLFFLLWIYLFVSHMRKAAQRQKLMKGIQEISGGNLYHQIREQDYTGNEKVIAGLLNNIQGGMQSAIDEQMKAERLRTDLITNVSHDIKTPLTSIINYVDLLKRENIQDPRIAGYVEVLDQKSKRLKQLTEDLVEASKISSGNIILNFSTLDLSQMIKQMNGEYEEKFAAKDLQIISRFADEAMTIRADGARMNRVLDNLYNNVAKYAMPGSRVYISVSPLTGKLNNGTERSYCVLSIKNISEHELNVRPEELMERFVRGDVSRTTEGSGLGLEIASNLTKMQGGTFTLSVDGDLFKAELAFPRV